MSITVSSLLLKFLNSNKIDFSLKICEQTIIKMHVARRTLCFGNNVTVFVVTRIIVWLGIK